MVDEFPQRDYFPIGQAVRRPVSPTQCLVVDGGVTRRSARRRSPRDAYVIRSLRSGKEEAGGRAASSGGVERGAPSSSSRRHRLRRRPVVDRPPPSDEDRNDDPANVNRRSADTMPPLPLRLGRRRSEDDEDAAAPDVGATTTRSGGGRSFSLAPGRGMLPVRSKSSILEDYSIYYAIVGRVAGGFSKERNIMCIFSGGEFAKYTHHPV